MSMREKALAYLNRGFSVIPLQGKKPAIRSWKLYMKIRPSGETVNQWFHNNDANIGLILGAVSGNVWALDLDGEGAVSAFKAAWPDWVGATTIVATGSGKGWHVYFRSPALPQSTRRRADGCGYEVRADGCYVVAPPSTHPDTGRPYEWAYRVPIAVCDPAPLVAWVESFAPVTDVAVTPKQGARRGGDVNEMYMNRAIDCELAALRATPQGGRNDKLFNAAYQLSRYVAGGELDGLRLYNELIGAALQVGLDRSEADATIASGFEWGARRPRTIPQRKY